jgi:tetratricopeptide (TPR) repeat protein
VSEQPGTSSASARRWTVALVVLAAVVPFAGTIRHGFAFDDVTEVVRNEQIRSLENLPRFFTQGAWEGAGERNPIYRPLTSVSYAINHALGGLHPVGFHLVNVLLHAGGSLLVLALALRLGLPLAGAAFAGVLFAVHPVHVEVVANVAGRKDELAAGFALLALLAHAAALRTGRRLALPVLALAAALFSKESGVAALAFIAGWDLLVGRDEWNRHRSRAAWLYGSYLAVFVLYLAARRAAVGSIGVPAAEIPFVENPLAHSPLPERLLTAVAVQGRGLLLLVAPLSLSPDYSWDAIPVLHTLSAPAFLAAAGALAAVAALALAWGRTQPAVAFAALLWAAALFPASNLLLPVGTIFGERLLYLPSVGFCLVLAFTAVQVPLRFRRAATALACFAVVLLGARSASYTAIWSDEVSLFAHAVAAQPRSAKAHQLYGEALMEAGRLDEGAEELAAAVEAMRRAPEVPPGLRIELGVARERQGRALEAERLYLGVLREHHGQPDALWRLGVLRWTAGHQGEAEQLWLRASTAAPEDARILADLGLAAASRGDTAAAEALWERATRLDPRIAGPWLSLGNLAERRGDLARAHQAWERFLENARYGVYPREREIIAAKLRAADQPK